GPRFSDWFREEAARLAYESNRRYAVAAVLERQNRGWGASRKTLANIDRLRAGAAVVVTGQQVGLFGGPAFAIYKGLTAARLAADASAGGVDTVPVFWLATEDHDLAEVKYASLPGPESRPVRITVATKGAQDAPVGSIRFADEINAAIS